MEGVVAVVPPPPRVYRVARRGGDPFGPPPWNRAGPDGTFGNRFDDPSAERGLTPRHRFRAVYWATTAGGAFGETVARFRPSIALLARLQEIDDDELLEAQLGEVLDPAALHAGVVPADWRLRRILAQTTLEPTLRFVDFAAPKTHQYLRHALAPRIAGLGLDDLDFSTLAGPHRTLTQLIARHIYELLDEAGMPLFSGVRYLSRLNLEWECWAVFHGRMKHVRGVATTIAPDNADLLAACRLLNLGIEATGREGYEVGPWRR